MNYAVGIDIGGTFIKAAIVQSNGTIVIKRSIPTQSGDPVDIVFSRIYELILQLLDQTKIDMGRVVGVGIGIPGIVDFATGIAYDVPNLGWKNISVIAPLQERLPVPIYLDNDANVASLGEMWVGAAKGSRDVFCVTLGTGVGGGVIVDGRPLRGSHLLSGEIGHIVVMEDGFDCRCGNKGCLETVASATGVRRLALHAIERHEETILDLDHLDAEAIFTAASQGDAVASNVIDQAVDVLGRGLGIMANLIDPEMIIVGGGMAAAGDALLEPLRTSFKKYTLRSLGERIRIVPAVLGNDAGVVGAAKLSFDQVILI